MVKIEDIYDIIEKPSVESYKFLLIALAISFVLGIVIFFIYYKHLKNRKISPEQFALKELKSLDVEKYFQEKRFDAFYEKLSEIVKTYFSHKTGTNCVSMSDTEFCQYLGDSVSKRHGEELGADLLIKIIPGFQKIKFARHEAIKQQMLDDISKIISVVKID